MNCFKKMFIALWFTTAAVGCASGDRESKDTDGNGDGGVDGGVDTDDESAAVEAQVDEILAGLTPEEKIGQMIQAEFRDVTAGEVRVK